MLQSWKKKALLLVVTTFLISLMLIPSALAEDITSTKTNNLSSPKIENIHDPCPEPIKVSQTKYYQKKNARVKRDGPYDPYVPYFDAIKAFNEELYGENG